MKELKPNLSRTRRRRRREVRSPNISTVTTAATLGATVADTQEEKVRRAAAAGHSQELQELLAAAPALRSHSHSSQRSSFLESWSLDGLTALHLAVSKGNAECAKILVDANADVNMQTALGLTALHLACRQGDDSVVEVLVAARANPLRRATNGALPLHMAAAAGNSKVLQCLLELGGGQQLQVRDGEGALPAEVARDVCTAELLARSNSAGALSTCSRSFRNQDSYAARLVFDHVLLRNSRADAVRRFLSHPVQLHFTVIANHGCGSRDLTSGFASASPSRLRFRLDRANDGQSRGVSSMSSDRGSSALEGSSPLSQRSRRSFSFGADSELPEVERVGAESFNLVKLLGKGAFGEVYEVVHKTTGKHYAMKMLKKRKVLRTSHVRYTFTERNLLSYVRHPYIVPLHFAFQTSNHLALVLQLCPNGNLQKLIEKQERLEVALTRHYMAEVLLAICYLHERRVIYRDLKPENVVLDKQNQALLTDFGLSKEGVEGPRGTRSFCGSLAFIAPEVLMRKGHGPAVDLYGLGVLLYVMLVGVPPYFSTARLALIENIRAAKLSVPTDVDTDAGELVRALMQREPTKRLGASQTSEVCQHTFFSGVDWAALMRREIPAPPLAPCARAEQPMSLQLHPHQPLIRRRACGCFQPADSDAQQALDAVQTVIGSTAGTGSWTRQRLLCLLPRLFRRHEDPTGSSRSIAGIARSAVQNRGWGRLRLTAYTRAPSSSSLGSRRQSNMVAGWEYASTQVLWAGQ